MIGHVKDRASGQHRGPRAWLATPGVLALGEVIRDRFDVEVEFIDLPNEV